MSHLISEKDRAKIEGVQRQVTKAIRSLERLTHGERFQRLWFFILRKEVKERKLTRDIKTMKDKGMITQVRCFPFKRKTFFAPLSCSENKS